MEAELAAQLDRAQTAVWVLFWLLVAAVAIGYDRTPEPVDPDAKVPPKPPARRR